MKLKHAAIALCLSSSAAFAQTTPPTTPSPAPSQPPAATVPGTPPAATMPSRPGSDATMTKEQADALIDKVVYSSDGKNVGEVAAVARDSTGKITEIHADIGGFLGLGETRVRVLPTQFKVADDRVTLMVTAEEAKTLPKLAKQ